MRSFLGDYLKYTVTYMLECRNLYTSLSTSSVFVKLDKNGDLVIRKTILSTNCLKLVAGEKNGFPDYKNTLTTFYLIIDFLLEASEKDNFEQNNILPI